MHLAPARVRARPAIAASCTSTAAARLAIHSIEQVAKALAQYGVSASTSATPHWHAGRGRAAAAAAVMGRQAPPRGVQRDEGPRRLS